MPRACVIVLDAVGAGALPDADQYGDEGSNTLANVAKAVNGLDLPTLEALGLGNVEPLDGCPPQPGAPAIAGRLIERSKGKDTTAGHWELMGIVTVQPFPTYPHGFPHDVIDPFMHRTGRGVLGNKPDAGHTVYGVGKIGDIFAGCDIDKSYPTKSNLDGIAQTERLLRERDEGFVFVNLVETDMLWGHRNDPVNFHRCLQDFDRRLPDLLDALRPGDLFVLTSDHGCDPTTPSTDHSREHALLLAYVQGRSAHGARHDGEFGDVGATVNAWLGGKAPSRGIPGSPILTP